MSVLGYLIRELDGDVHDGHVNVHIIPEDEVITRVGETVCAVVPADEYEAMVAELKQLRNPDLRIIWGYEAGHTDGYQEGLTAGRNAVLGITP